MLPLLMMMNGGGKKGGGMPDMSSLLNVMGGGNKKGGLDMVSLMQMMTALQSSGASSGVKRGESTNSHEPTNPDLKKLQGMLSPEMIEILKALGRK